MGAMSSCKKDPVSSHCDTCKTDTTHHQCDTCNLNKDSLAHAFTWKEFSISGESNLVGVWVFGQNDIYIVGNALWHFDGTNFTNVPAIRNGSNTTLNGALSGFSIFAFDKIEFWMVSGSIAFHTSDGKYFDDIRPGNVNACWGSTPNDVFIIGNSGHIAHWDGTKFTDMPSGTTKDLSSVWGTSHNDVWATGWNSSAGTTVLLHYDGLSWTEDQFSTSGKINQYAIGSVWACDSAGVPTAVMAGTRVFHKTGSGPWRADTSEVGNSLGSGNYIGISVTGGTSSDLFAVGGWGFASHWNGKTWKKYDTLFDINNADYGAQGISMNGNTICIVGVKGGGSWVAIGTRKQ